jgi:hypothetical protein
MNKFHPAVIGVHLEDGIVQGITTDSEWLAGATAVVIADGEPSKALVVADDDDQALSGAAPKALDATRCHGIGIACDLAGERLIKLGRTKFDDPKAFTSEIILVLEGLRDMLAASMRLQSVEDCQLPAHT